MGLASRELSPYSEAEALDCCLGDEKGVFREKRTTDRARNMTPIHMYWLNDHPHAPQSFQPRVVKKKDKYGTLCRLWL
jgi:hypothetical protein